VTYSCAANAAMDEDGMKNRAFDKKRSRGRIDGLVTIAMGVGAADATMKEERYAGSFFVDLEDDADDGDDIDAEEG
jgi:phage terminase large subunit-like protein